MHLSRALDVNNRGHIVGFGAGPDGLTHGFCSFLSPLHVCCLFSPLQRSLSTSHAGPEDDCSRCKFNELKRCNSLYPAAVVPVALLRLMATAKHMCRAFAHAMYTTPNIHK